MKTKIITLALGSLIAGLVTAKADTRVNVGIGVGYPSYSPAPVYSAPVYAPVPAPYYTPSTTVVTAPSYGYDSPSYGYGTSDYGYESGHYRHGHWENVATKV